MSEKSFVSIRIDMAPKRLFIVAKDASKPTVSLLKFEPRSQIFLHNKPYLSYCVNATMK